MLGFLMEDNKDGSNAMNAYLSREKRKAEKELESFKKEKEREKNDKIR